MTNEIINNLLIDGSIVKGDFFQKLQSDFSDVFERKQSVKKALTEKHQTNFIRAAYKVALRTKFDLLTEDDYGFISNWNEFSYI